MYLELEEYDEQLEDQVERWEAFGPYYAMFPVEFAFDIVNRYSDPGQLVVDPFCGRGTAVYAAAASDRTGYGCEINPVGWIYGSVKLHPASEDAVINRLEQIYRMSTRNSSPQSLPPYFGFAFSPRILRFLWVARRELQWRTRIVDRTLMAFILVYLHGKVEAALSNQMRQTKSMSPDYSIAWWKARRMRPPEHHPVEFLAQRIHWRYAPGVPQLRDSTVRLGNAAKRISELERSGRRWSLLLTSPPYCGVTNYWYDQWLRLWMLGEEPYPTSGTEHTGRFVDAARYRRLLQNVFSAAARSARRDATIYVRTDARPFTHKVTAEVLKETFPNKTLRTYRRPVVGKLQTQLFDVTAPRVGEVDLVLR